MAEETWRCRVTRPHSCAVIDGPDEPQVRAGEVNLSPAEVRQLADPQPAEDQRREQRPIFAGRVEHRLRLVRFEPRAVRCRGTQPTALASRRITVDQLVFDRLVQDALEEAQAPVDRVFESGRSTSPCSRSRSLLVR
jgi:hypothetical protein